MRFPACRGRSGRATTDGARGPTGRWQDSPMTRPAHPRVAEVADLLAVSGASGQVRELSGSARTAAEAAGQLGVPVGAIANSLLFDVDGAPVLVLTSGGHRVDEVHVAGLLGVPHVARASADFVRRHTGLPIGGAGPRGCGGGGGPPPAPRSRSAPWSTWSWPATTVSGPRPGTLRRSSPPAT